MKEEFTGYDDLTTDHTNDGKEMSYVHAIRIFFCQREMRSMLWM